ncbi:MAG: D-inositol-3-phosphate glycosyltransferase [Candidatus Argoarchaeum ethanivorans]|uniref:D-inositol-3-phosphate glycosyltransferase n=1 Tax=Candidatus Argoarchaeum ethanivorans TaxID=2608793 RepID=A0A812A0E5_9EURY|nr:MAG: D-inositol-3-phosphate glycosyltransferase [Candidatus Argoarchaeum ethanivorans]
MNICMVAYTFYESDNRIRRYAETLVKRGDSVSVFSLKREGQGSFGVLNGVEIYRIQERIVNEKGKLSYLYKLLKFFVLSTCFLAKEHIKKPYDLIHVHSVPDFEVFAAVLPKLMGAKIILDIHDIVPEFYCSKFNTKKDSLIFKCLVLIEKLSIKFADHTIISNHIWYDTLVSRSVKKEKCTTILNYPDNTLFIKNKKVTNNDKIIMLYPGTLNWHQGLDIAIKAFARIAEQTPFAEFHIYGDGSSKNDLEKMVLELGVENKVFVNGLVSIDEIVSIMSNADIGIIPKRNDSFGGEAFSTKSLEFMLLGVPIIVSKTKIDDYYFNESIVKYFEPESDKELAVAMLSLIKNKEERKKLSQNALNYVAAKNWESKKTIYINLVNSILPDSNRNVK